MTILTKPPTKLEIKPIRTAFGAYGYTIGQSKAGFEFGTRRSEIPLNAGTISPKMIRIPLQQIDQLIVMHKQDYLFRYLIQFQYKLILQKALQLHK